MSRFDRIVRCDRGHFYTTIWVPLASFKAFRFGWRRWQRCPLGHWGWAEPVDPTTLAPDELAQAQTTHDVRIP